MAFFKFHKASKSAAGNAAGAGGGRSAVGPRDDVQDLRVRARNRLIGAVALVVLAIIVFPLLFDTEQRPVVVDAPVVIAGAQQPAAVDEPVIPPPQVDVPPQEALPEAGAPGDVTESAATVTDPGADGNPVADDAAGREEWVLGPEIQPVADPDPEAEAVDAELEPSATRSKIRVAQGPARQAGSPAAGSAAPTPARAADSSTPARTAANDAEARRALAALQGRSAPQQAAPGAPAAPAVQRGRYVVQVGAYAQEEQVRSVQQRIANAGLKSHTQVVQTGAGPRTRVRVGPYDSRDAAERARAALEKGGLPGQVLTL